MTAFNRVIIAGNVARDIQVRSISGGSSVADVSLAINSQWKDKKSNEKKEETTFVDCTLWGKTAELAGEYLKKGSSVLFEGRLQMDSWQDKESGAKRSKLKVVVETMQFLGSPSGGGGNKKPSNQQQSFNEYDEPRGGYRSRR